MSFKILSDTKLSRKTPPPGSGPGIVVRKDPTESEKSNGTSTRQWLKTPAGFLEGLCRVGDRPLKLYSYQRQDLNDPALFQHRNKGRQTGFSFIKAGKGLARSHQMDDYTRIFVSMNQEEADEKIRYARALFDSMPAEYQKRLAVDNKHSLEFESLVGFGRRRARTRLISIAQRPPRGKGTNTDVCLDEFAHYQFERKIYAAALPILSRGGQLEVGSTPFGDKNMHYEICHRKDRYPGFSRQSVPWWWCADLCANPKAAIREADFMSAGELVMKYGTEMLKMLFLGMDLEDFEQEFCCKFVSEATSYFPTELIHPCCFPIEDSDYSDVDPSYVGEKVEWPLLEKYPKVEFTVYGTIDELALAIQEGKVSPYLLAGYDVGRKQNKAELIILEELGEKEGFLQVVRYRETFANEKFRDQRDALIRVLRTISDMKLGIGGGGQGMQLAEDLTDLFSDRIKTIVETVQSNSAMIVDAHIRFEDLTIAIPFDRNLISQVHAIKKSTTLLGATKFDVQLSNEEKKRHHADQFFALIYGSSQGTPAAERRVHLFDSVVGGGLGPQVRKVSEVPNVITSAPSVSSLPSVRADRSILISSQFLPDRKFYG